MLFEQCVLCPVDIVAIGRGRQDIGVSIALCVCVRGLEGLVYDSGISRASSKMDSSNWCFFSCCNRGVLALKVRQHSFFINAPCLVKSSCWLQTHLTMAIPAFIKRKKKPNQKNQQQTKDKKWIHTGLSWYHQGRFLLESKNVFYHHELLTHSQVFSLMFLTRCCYLLVLHFF